MDWFRWWHGTVTDPKFQWVARKSAQPVGSVIAVWACLLEHASMQRTATHATRGNVASFDCNAFDVALGFDDGVVQKIFSAMEQKGMIADRCIAKWEERQPKREDSGNPNTGALSSTERSRLHREKVKREATDATATQRNATQGNDRGEEIRGEEEKEDMSGQPDSSDLKAVIDHLNARTGSTYRHVESNLKLVRDRLKSGATVDQCKAVIDAKVDQWGADQKMSEYLRPTTLFRASNFESYLGQLDQQSSANAAEAAAEAAGATFIPGMGRCY